MEFENDTFDSDGLRDVAMSTEFRNSKLKHVCETVCR